MKEQIRLGVWETNSSSVNTLMIMTAEEYKDFKTLAYVGKEGFTKDKKEGDWKTPVGEFDLGVAFGKHDNTVSVNIPFPAPISNIFISS